MRPCSGVGRCGEGGGRDIQPEDLEILVEFSEEDLEGGDGQPLRRARKYEFRIPCRGEGSGLGAARGRGAVLPAQAQDRRCVPDWELPGAQLSPTRRTVSEGVNGARGAGLPRALSNSLRAHPAPNCDPFRLCHLLQPLAHSPGGPFPGTSVLPIAGGACALTRMNE